MWICSFYRENCFDPLNVDTEQGDMETVMQLVEKYDAMELLGVPEPKTSLEEAEEFFKNLFKDFSQR